MADASVEALIARGHEAFRRGDAEASREAFEAALVEEETAETLEGLARARHLAVDYKGSIEAHERAFAAYKVEGDALGAAQVARLLAWAHGNVYGDWAVSNGWRARAERLLEPAGGETVEHGWLEALRALQESHGEAREKHLRIALDLGRRFGDPDLEFEALAAVCAGQTEDLYLLEGVFCGMFLMCELTHDVVRADQWIRAAQETVRDRKIEAVGAFCRAHYGGILTAAGRWEEAEAALREAAKIFERGYVAGRGSVMVRLADLRVRQGRLEEARVLLEGLDQRPDAARPLAALLVDVHLAEGSVERASDAADRLAQLAAGHESHYLEAAAAMARGKLCLASGSGDARSCLREALSAFSLARMPVELARARLELARAVVQEQPEVAVAEAKAALEEFELREAARDADAAAALLRSLGAAGRSGPRRRAELTKRESEVLDLLAHGLSNAEIAERLVISPKTAEHHVSRVLSKLGLRNRAEAAAYAARVGGR